MQIDLLRSAIDDIDKLIVRWLNLRMILALEIGREKIADGLPVVDTLRERHVIREARSFNTGPSHGKQIEDIFWAIVAASRTEQIRQAKELKKEKSQHEEG